MSRYQFIEQEATTAPVQVLCRVLAVSAAGYYQWLRQTDRPTPAWKPAGTAAFSRHAQHYGTRRLRVELRAEGHAVGRYALGTPPWPAGAEHAPPAPTHDRRGPSGGRGRKLLLNQPAPTAPN